MRQSTRQARSRVPVTLGTLIGTKEMFALLAEGCDERFVDYLMNDDQCEEEADAFREFLFGSTTETLKKLERRMEEQGRTVIGPDELGAEDRVTDLCSGAVDQAVALKPVHGAQAPRTARSFLYGSGFIPAQSETSETARAKSSRVTRV